MKRFFLALCAILMIPNAYQQSSISRAQSILILEISEMVEWPADNKQKPFIIGILGESGIRPELEAYTRDKTLNSRDITVEIYEKPEEIKFCHVLFIPFSQTRLIYEAVKDIGYNSTLIITERSGGLKAGAAVNFLVNQEKVQFEISAENAAKHGLVINSGLKELAVKK
jgi:hypothetical protein